jgi:putative aldouronate transport system permease protein
MVEKFKSYRTQKKIGLFTLSLPGLLFVLVFSYIPMVGVVLAFKRLRFDLGIFGSPWVGLSNFEFFFKSDVAWRLIRNTVMYSLSFMVIGTIAALTLALLLNELTRRWVKIHQTILFLPYFLSWVIVAYLVEGFLDHNRGFINNVITTLGGDAIRWYAESDYWPYILNIVTLWKGIGFGALIYYAGILGIDPSLYEAAKMDGANRWQMIKGITIPLLSTLISIMIILSIGGMMTVDFGLFYFVPKNSTFLYSTTDVINTYVYRSLIDIGDIGMSTAVGLFQSLVGLILVFGANFVIRKINDENSLW